LDRITCASQVRDRFDEAQLSGLAQSLSETGLLQPILVRPCADGWIVVDGERRVRSARAAGWTTIPAIVESAELSEAQCLQQQLVANCQRENLTPIETARAIDRLMKGARWSRAHVAARLGLSPASVSRSLALLGLPADVQERIHNGELAASTGYEIAKTGDPGRRAELVATATRGELKRDVAAKHARVGGKRRRSSAQPRRRQRVVIPMRGGHALHLMVTNLDLVRLIEAMDDLTACLRALNPGEGSDLTATLTALAARIKGTPSGERGE
jgi:ParB/RepB/Spo0J family partition protein